MSFIATSLSGFGAAPSDLRSTYITGVGNATNGTSFTFSSVSLGDVSADRYILVGIFGVVGSVFSISSCTVAGVSGTELYDTPLDSGGAHMGFYIAAVPTGTSGDIVVTFSTSLDTCLIHVWRLQGVLTPGSAHATANNTGTPTASVDIAVPAGGGAFALSRTVSSTFTWVGVNEDNDGLTTESNTVSAGSQIFPGVVTQTVSATTASGTSRMAVVTLR